MRLHSLPSGTEAELPSPITSWFLRAFLGLGISFVGCFFVISSGWYFGLSRGIGPEQTGGALYILPGLVFNLLAGAIIAAFVARRSASRTMPRLVFYSFTAPAFIAVVLMAFSIARQLLR